MWLDVYFENWRRSRLVVKSWVGEHGYRLVSAERRRVGEQGPFPDSNEYQDVYFVTVQDPAGRTARAFVRVGTRFFDHFLNRVEVKWE